MIAHNHVPWKNRSSIQQHQQDDEVRGPEELEKAATNLPVEAGAFGGSNSIMSEEDGGTGSGGSSLSSTMTVLWMSPPSTGGSGQVSSSYTLVSSNRQDSL